MVGVMDERIIVSPVAGVFSTAGEVPPTLTAGTLVGYVNDIPIISPFDGELVDVVAVDGERLEPYQRVAWLRAA
jgi:hypothetical protein